MSDFTDLSTDDLAAELARRQSDDQAANAATARAGLASGGVGDTGAPDIDPRILAKQAIQDGIHKQHLSREEAVALGVAQIMNAAIKGDTRVNYRGRVEPGV